MRIARPAQVDMVRGISKTPRHQLVASMGLGKSGAVLLRASALEWELGAWPGLVIVAPLQVAFAWVREIPLWLPGKSVSLVVGNAEQRKAALNRTADVTIMTYDNIPWVDQVFAGENWSRWGQLMVCDESTRIKNTRATWMISSAGKRFLRTDGGIQTRTMAKHAADFSYWVNATGTPSPNGLDQVWGQYWYIDGGARLGTSFTAFSDRWFRIPVQGGEFAKPEPIPGAAEEIAARIADVTTICRVEDYYQLDKPNIIDRMVVLPSKAATAYNEMKTKKFTEIVQGLGTKSISALSAAAKVAKLAQIAAGFAYYRDEEVDPEITECAELHTVKIDAVESILEETQEPLVVVYYHKATLALLRRRFKERLRELDDRGQAQDDWNAGNIEILALQYQSGGVGLSLQHGGRNICLLEPTYRADDMAQVLERLGPMRQMQSGYNRAVNVFRVLAAGTVDRMIMDKVAAKQNLESLLIDLIQSNDSPTN